MPRCTKIPVIWSVKRSHWPKTSICRCGVWWCSKGSAAYPCTMGLVVLSMKSNPQSWVWCTTTSSFSKNARPDINTLRRFLLNDKVAVFQSGFLKGGLTTGNTVSTSQCLLQPIISGADTGHGHLCRGRCPYRTLRLRQYCIDATLLKTTFQHTYCSSK